MSALNLRLCSRGGRGGGGGTSDFLMLKLYNMPVQYANAGTIFMWDMLQTKYTAEKFDY